MLKKRVTDEIIYLIKAAFAYAVMMALVVMLSSLLASTLEESELLILESEAGISTAMLELVGMQALRQFPPQIEIFFLLLMVTNLVVCAAVIGHSVHRMRESYEKGGFAFYYAQVMRPWQYYIMTGVRILLSAELVWGIYIAMVYGALKVLSQGIAIEVVIVVFNIISEMALRGLVIILLMSVVGILYGIKQNYKMHGVDYGLCLIGVGFLVGNAYKIPQLIGQKQIEEMVNAQDMMQLTYAIKQLRVACPFSWLNPFNIYHTI